MSAYDLLLPVPVFPAPEIYSENSLPYSPLAVMPEDNPKTPKPQNPVDLNLNKNKLEYKMLLK